MKYRGVVSTTIAVGVAMLHSYALLSVDFNCVSGLSVFNAQHTSLPSQPLSPPDAVGELIGAVVPVFWSYVALPLSKVVIIIATSRESRLTT